MRFAQGKSQPPQEGACRRLTGWSDVSPSTRSASLATLSTVACAPGARILLQDFLMTPKTIATLLILLACATTGANLASAQGSGPWGQRLRTQRFQRRRLTWWRRWRLPWPGPPTGPASTDEEFTDQASLGTGSWTVAAWGSKATASASWHSRWIYTPAQQPSLPCESFAFIAIDSAQAFRQVGMRGFEKCYKQRTAS